MELFNKELSELKARAAAGAHSVGSKSDLQKICKGVDDLASFKVDVLDCTKVSCIVVYIGLSCLYRWIYFTWPLRKQR